MQDYVQLGQKDYQENDKPTLLEQVMILKMRDTEKATMSLVSLTKSWNDRLLSGGTKVMSISQNDWKMPW